MEKIQGQATASNGKSASGPATAKCINILANSINELIDENTKLKEAIRYLADVSDYAKQKGYKSAKLDKINQILNDK